MTVLEEIKGETCLTSYLEISSAKKMFSNETRLNDEFAANLFRSYANLGQHTVQVWIVLRAGRKSRPKNPPRDQPEKLTRKGTKFQ